MLPMAIRPIRHPRHDRTDTHPHRQRPTLLPQPPLRTFLYPTCTRQPQRRRTISQPQREKKKGKRKKHRPRTPQCPAAIAVGHCAFRPARAWPSRALHLRRRAKPPAPFCSLHLSFQPNNKENRDIFGTDIWSVCNFPLPLPPY